MRITDLWSYVTTGQEFESHWTDVDADRVANTLPEGLDADQCGYGRAEFHTAAGVARGYALAAFQAELATLRAHYKAVTETLCKE